jgi:hypothetical protein
LLGVAVVAFPVYLDARPRPPPVIPEIASANIRDPEVERATRLQVPAHRAVALPPE